VTTTGRESARVVAEELRRAAHSPKALDRLLEEAEWSDLDVRHAILFRLPSSVAAHILKSRRFGARPAVLGALALSPTTPVSRVVSILNGLGWRDLSTVATSAELAPAVRQRAESILLDQCEELRVGDRISLGRTSPARVAARLLQDVDARVRASALLNPRLRADDLAQVFASPRAPRGLFAEALELHRWRDAYPVKLAIARSRRAPRPVALSVMTSLQRTDLRDLAESPPVGVDPFLVTVARKILASAEDAGERRAVRP
jgi:hypothetical protein